MFHYTLFVAESGEPCHQARQVVGEYRDIIAGLKNVADNYKKGKDSLDLHRESVHRQLEDSLKDLSDMGMFFLYILQRRAHYLHNIGCVNKCFSI